MGEFGGDAHFGLLFGDILNINRGYNIIGTSLEFVR